MPGAMAGGFRDVEPGTTKFLVLRRDGSVPDWTWFVLGAADKHAPAALAEYGREVIGVSGSDRDLEAYGVDMLRLSDEFDAERERREAAGKKKGDPEAKPHRKDDPLILALMKGEVTWEEIREAVVSAVQDRPGTFGKLEEVVASR